MLEVQPQAKSLEALRIAVREHWREAFELSPKQLSQRFPQRKNLLAAWRLPGQLAIPPRDLIVAVDKDFPWTLPTVALAEIPDPAPYPGNVFWPHVEEDAKFCLTPASAPFTLPTGIRHIVQLVDDARKVITSGRTRANDDDFYSEAHSYWLLRQPSKHSVWLCAPPPSHHAIWRTALNGDTFIVAPDKRALEDWASAAQRPILDQGPAVILHLPAPLHPVDYPVTMSQLIGFIRRSDAPKELTNAVQRWKGIHELPVIITFEHAGKPVCLGAALIPPSQIRLKGSQRNGIRGFRSGNRGSPNTRLAALDVPAPFPRMRVTHTYREFLRARTAGESASQFRECHLVVIGCGAIGGQLAVQLAQAGVGRLTLIDDDTLTWQNIGRHVLDSSAVGERKSIAIAKSIKRRFPDAIVDAITETWEDCKPDEVNVLTKADLLIAATGNAASNLRLDALAAEDKIAPVIYAWIEPFGVAAHAVLRYPGSRHGLSAITDNYGRLIDSVVDIDSAPPLPKEPACGAFYGPYSSLSALPSVTLAGQLALDALSGRVQASVHRVWVGAESEFSDNGLSLHPVWWKRLNRDGYNRRFDLCV